MNGGVKWSSLVGIRGSELSDDIYRARSRQLANADQYCMEITGFEDTAKHPLTTALPEIRPPNRNRGFFPQNRTETDRSRPVWNRNNTTDDESGGSEWCIVLTDLALCYPSCPGKSIKHVVICCWWRCAWLCLVVNVACVFLLPVFVTDGHSGLIWIILPTWVAIMTESEQNFFLLNESEHGNGNFLTQCQITLGLTMYKIRLRVHLFHNVEIAHIITNHSTSPSNKNTNHSNLPCAPQGRQ